MGNRYYNEEFEDYMTDAEASERALRMMKFWKSDKDMLPGLIKVGYSVKQERAWALFESPSNKEISFYRKNFIRKFRKVKKIVSGNKVILKYIP